MAGVKKESGVKDAPWGQLICVVRGKICLPTQSVTSRKSGGYPPSGLRVPEDGIRWRQEAKIIKPAGQTQKEQVVGKLHFQ